MVKETAIWAYPWDLVDEGVEAAVDHIASLGLDAISLAVVYHSGKFISPRNPKRRVYFPEDGVIYFKHNQSKFEGMPLQPARSKLVAEDVVGRAERHCKSRRMQFVAWTVGTHNTRLASSHLDLAACNAFGDHYLYALCPSHDAVREYLKTLVGDLLEHYPFDAVELESYGHTGFLHGYHHEFYSVSLALFEQALLALCFCPACGAMASEAGVDFERLRTEVRAAIDRNLSVPARLPSDSIAQLLEFIQAQAFIRKRCESVTRLVAEIAEIVHAKGAKLYCTGAVFAQPTSLGWIEGIDAQEISRVADRFEISLYFENSEKKTAEAYGVASLGLPCQLEAALNVGHPYTRTGEDLVNDARLAEKAGFTSIGFYNYGTLPDYRLRWIAQSISSLRGTP